MNRRVILREYLLILLGSLLYAVSTVLFIFPQQLLLGGTSGISVILTAAFDVSPGTILTVINFALIILAFLILGRDMAIKTLVGSILTTLSITVLEKPLTLDSPLIANPYLSSLIGAAIIAVASGIMFYVDSSSGGTDVIALILQKFSKMQIGKALLVTDVLIVLVGGLVSERVILFSSAAGFLVKVLGIDAVIGIIQKIRSHRKEHTHAF